MFRGSIQSPLPIRAGGMTSKYLLEVPVESSQPSGIKQIWNVSGSEHTRHGSQPQPIWEAEESSVIAGQPQTPSAHFRKNVHLPVSF